MSSSWVFETLALSLSPCRSEEMSRRAQKSPVSTCRSWKARNLWAKLNQRSTNLSSREKAAKPCRVNTPSTDGKYMLFVSKSSKWWYDIKVTSIAPALTSVSWSSGWKPVNPKKINGLQCNADNWGVRHVRRRTHHAFFDLLVAWAPLYSSLCLSVGLSVITAFFCTF